MKIASVEIINQTFHLHPEKAIFWEEEKMLLLADLHLGKGAHFRKEGIAVPTNIIEKELKKIGDLIDLFDADRVVFLGDLFHSVYNPEWERFGQWMQTRKEVSFELVIGNHDILSTHQYEKYNLLIHENHLEVHAVLLTHAPLDEVPFGKYNLAGHIHPGVKLYGNAKQQIKLPCYYFDVTQGLLPAFGAFTGLCILQPNGRETVYVITEDEVIQVN